MILLDTNVVSEPLRRSPERCVGEWIDAQPMETLYLCAITVAELRTCVAQLPAGKRRAGLHDNLEKRLLPLFAGRILPFDVTATHAYAALMARSRAKGRTIATADGCIAAIAATNGLAVATRDVVPFESAGVIVINPWKQ